MPQDPNDEPAAVLLEKIRAEKERLVKEGKLKKKDLEVKPIAEDEIPFEIPKGWEWCRIGDLFNHSSGKQQSSSNNGKGTPQKFITTSNLYWGRFVLDNVKVMNFTDEEIITCSATKGDLLVCEGGAGYGRSAIWDKDYDICLQNHVHRLRPCIPGVCEYVYHFLYLLKESNQLAPVGTAMPGLSANRLKDLILPLPPLAEQHRIVAKIEELMPLVEKYGAAQETLDEWNHALPEKLKKSILQEAIQGKLVPQDPADEPASVLLECLRKEKLRLVKEGHIYKKKDTSPLFSEEDSPFEIPNNWVWAQLSDVSIIQEGAGIRKHQYTQEGTQLLCVTNILDGRIDLKKKLLFVSNEEYKQKYQHLTPQVGDIVTACSGGSWGKVAIYNCTEIVMLNTSTLRMRFFNDLADNLYLYYLCQSDFFKNQLSEQLVGIQPNFGYAHYSRIVFPLPPLAEQRRIVAKIEELFGVIKK